MKIRLTKNALNNLLRSKEFNCRGDWKTNWLIPRLSLKLCIVPFKQRIHEVSSTNVQRFSSSMRNLNISPSVFSKNVLTWHHLLPWLRLPTTNVTSWMACFISREDKPSKCVRMYVCVVTRVIAASVRHDRRKVHIQWSCKRKVGTRDESSSQKWLNLHLPWITIYFPRDWRSCQLWLNIRAQITRR